MKATKRPKAATASTIARPIETSGTNTGSARTVRRTSSAYTKVPRNTASVTWYRRLSRKVRSTRGLSWLEASVRATTVTENASPATETVAPAIVESMPRAPSALPPKPSTENVVCLSASSI